MGRDIKHTKGPWSFEHVDDLNGVVGPNSTVIFSKRPEALAILQHANKEHREADGRLIAAAPELLELAKYTQTAIKVGSSLHVNGDFIKKLDAAIAKATGVQS